jgi:ASC-1-like (ASCH) protein
MNHVLNCSPTNFQSLKSGQKAFEVTVNDRDFQVKDKIIFCELDDANTHYTGKRTALTVQKIITSNLSKNPYHKKGYCILIFKHGHQHK